MLFQGSKFNRQIPAKVYEYLRIGRPIFALVAPDGDTATALRDTGGAAVAPPQDVAGIARCLSEFADALREGHAPYAFPEVVAKHSRRSGAASLADLLDQTCV